MGIPPWEVEGGIEMPDRENNPKGALKCLAKKLT